MNHEAKYRLSLPPIVRHAGCSYDIILSGSVGVVDDDDFSFGDRSRLFAVAVFSSGIVVDSLCSAAGARGAVVARHCSWYDMLLR